MNILTKKQQAVYEMACTGTSYKKIARDLHYANGKVVSTILRGCRLKGFYVEYGKQLNLF